MTFAGVAASAPRRRRSRSAATSAPSSSASPPAPTTSAIAVAINQLKAPTGVSAPSSPAGSSGSTRRSSAREQFVSVKTIAGIVHRTARTSAPTPTVNINGSQAEVDGLIASVRTGDLDVTLTLDSDFAQTTSRTGTDASTITGGGAKFQLGSQVNRQGQINVGIGSVVDDQARQRRRRLPLEPRPAAAPTRWSAATRSRRRRSSTAAIRQVADAPRPARRVPEGRPRHERQQPVGRAGERDRQRERHPRRRLRGGDRRDDAAQILVQANTSVLAQANAAAAERAGAAEVGRKPDAEETPRAALFGPPSFV